MENSGYLLAAFILIWLVVFMYIFILINRQKKLRQEIDSLKKAHKENEASK